MHKNFTTRVLLALINYGPMSAQELAHMTGMDAVRTKNAIGNCREVEWVTSSRHLVCKYSITPKGRYRVFPKEDPEYALRLERAKLRKRENNQRSRKKRQAAERVIKAEEPEWKPEQRIVIAPIRDEQISALIQRRGALEQVWAWNYLGHRPLQENRDDVHRAQTKIPLCWLVHRIQQTRRTGEG